MFVVKVLFTRVGATRSSNIEKEGPNKEGFTDVKNDRKETSIWTLEKFSVFSMDFNVRRRTTRVQNVLGANHTSSTRSTNFFVLRGHLHT